jgi:hypothetical protein
MAGETVIFFLGGLGYRTDKREKQGNRKNQPCTNYKFNGSHGFAPF